MKRSILCLALAGALLLAAVPARAHDAYDDSQSNPLRVVAYVLNPVGVVIEWVAARPMHFLASNPGLERFFGHAPHENPFGSYEPYEPYDADEPARAD